MKPPPMCGPSDERLRIADMREEIWSVSRLEERQYIIDRCAEIWPDKKVLLVQTDDVDFYVTLEDDARIHTFNSDVSLSCCTNKLLPGTGMHLECLSYQLERFTREIKEAKKKKYETAAVVHGVDYIQ